MKYLKTYEEKQGITFNEWLKRNPQDINTIGIDCNFQKLTDLDGIQDFKNLQELYCSDNQLQELPLQGLVNLQVLDCENNQLQELPLQGLVNLQVLYCENNQLKKLDLEGLVNLQGLYCQGNQLSYEDLEGYWKWWEKEYPDRAEAKKFNF